MGKQFDEAEAQRAEADAKEAAERLAWEERDVVTR